MHHSPCTKSRQMDIGQVHFLNLINSIFLNVEKEQGQYPVFLMKQEVSLAWRLHRK